MDMPETNIIQAMNLRPWSSFASNWSYEAARRTICHPIIVSTAPM